MLKITEPLEHLELPAYACHKYFIDNNYCSNRVIIKFKRNEDGDMWNCERAEYLQKDICNRRDKGEQIKFQSIDMSEKDVLEIINDFIEHTICTITLEYSVWGYNHTKNEEYDNKMMNTRRC